MIPCWNTTKWLGINWTAAAALKLSSSKDKLGYHTYKPGKMDEMLRISALLYIPISLQTAIGE
jgi:hypothetical protein